MIFTDGFTHGTAIVPVALYGMPYKIDEIMAIADKYGIPVVEANEAFIGC